MVIPHFLYYFASVKTIDNNIVLTVTGSDSTGESGAQADIRTITELGSFRAHAPFAGVVIPMTFIRAPYIERVGPDVEVLATVGGHIVAAQQANQLVTAFHPELDDCQEVYKSVFGAH